MCWCFVRLGWSGVDVRCILYYYILYILSYTILFSSSDLPSLPIPLFLISSPIPNIHSIRVGTYIYLFISYTILFHLLIYHSFLLLPFFLLLKSSPLQIYLPSPNHPSLPSHPSHSKYTCRHLNPLIYILNTNQEFWPRMFYRSGWLRCVGFICVVSFVHCYRWAFEGLSWCSSVCRMIGVGLLYYPSNNSDPACFIGVDGWGVWCVFVWCRFEVCVGVSCV